MTCRAIASLCTVAILMASCASPGDPAVASTPPAGPVRPGGEISAPVALHRVEPSQPKDVSETGRVLLEMIIGTDGVPHDIIVLESPHPKLSEISIEAAKGWKFRPGMYRGQPVEVIFNIQIMFR